MRLVRRCPVRGEEAALIVGHFVVYILGGTLFLAAVQEAFAHGLWWQALPAGPVAALSLVRCIGFGDGEMLVLDVEARRPTLPPARIVEES